MGKSKRLWNKNDTEILKDNYGELSASEITKLLSTKRTPKAVRSMANKLGLRRLVYIEDYQNKQYKNINNIEHKLCKQCLKYYPNTSDYFPVAKDCLTGLRNICRECKGEEFKFNSNVHIWSKEDEYIMKKHYADMSNNRLIKEFFPDLTRQKIINKAFEMGLIKNENGKEEYLKEVGKFNSKRLKEIGKWSSKDNPQYGSERVGKLNPNYNGGISSVYQYLRRNIKEWKIDSMKSCNYACIFTGERFNDIHHLYPFNKIIGETMNELKFPVYDNISKYTQSELENIKDKCLEIHYKYPFGVCMQSKYHLLFHSEYSWSDFNQYDFQEFIIRFQFGEFDDILKIA